MPQDASMNHPSRRPRRTFTALVGVFVCALLVSCGGGGGSSGTAPSTNLANVCSVQGQKSFIRAYLGENYYWYNEIPALNANLFGSAVDYFYNLLVTTPDANGLPKDQFSFVATVADANSFETGISAGFGVQWELDALGRTRVAQVTAGSPAAASPANMARGGLLLNVVSTNTPSWYPNAFGAFISFDYQDTPGAATRRITLNSASLVESPVPRFSVVNTVAGKTVGYVLFNDHSGTAQDQLITAISSLGTSGIRDLVLDMRYNGGGFLYVAQSLASMVTGPVSDGRVFERLQFNDQRAADSAAFVFNFSPVVEFSEGSTPVGAPLPRLALPRVYVLTSGSTCSASESVVNGLRGVDVNVVLVGGGSSCGKPYGFTRRDNCGLALFPIEFEGFNARNTGGYTAGFAPTCVASDDFDHALGDVNERQLAAALFHADNGFCPPAAVAAPSALASVRKSPLGGNAASVPGKPPRPGKLLVGSKP